MRIHGGMTHQRGQDRRHGEHVADPVLLDQRPDLRGVELLAGGHHRHRAARDLGELVDPGAMRQRRDDEGRVALRGARHQVGQWFVTTKESWPCVSTAALGRPVVPEV